jgi:hypothetical protein
MQCGQAQGYWSYGEGPEQPNSVPGMGMESDLSSWGLALADTCPLVTSCSSQWPSQSSECREAPSSQEGFPTSATTSSASS